jgi:Mrp family chromosome partitioning ATPase
MKELVAWARGRYDYVVLDTPPVSAVTDAAVLAPHADAVLVVVRAEHTPRRAVTHCMKLLAGVGAKVLGAVLNDAGRADGGDYYYMPGRPRHYYEPRAKE